MGIKVVLESENGEQIESFKDNKNVLHEILPGIDDDNYCMVKYIDWYGDTVFNRLQAERLLLEVNNLNIDTNNIDHNDMIDKLRQLCERLNNEVHVYLKFYGD